MRDSQPEVSHEFFRVFDAAFDENGDGIITHKRFSAPSASQASAATSAESMPPESPTGLF
jgi:hypothetical protein